MLFWLPGLAIAATINFVMYMLSAGTYIMTLPMDFGGAWYDMGKAFGGLSASIGINLLPVLKFVSVVIAGLLAAWYVMSVAKHYWAWVGVALFFGLMRVIVELV